MVSDIGIGDRVILSQSKRNKLTTRFEKEPYDVVDRDGNAALGNTERRGATKDEEHCTYEEAEWLPRDITTLTSIPVGNSDGGCEPTVSIPRWGTSDGDREVTVSNPVTVDNSGGDSGEYAPVVPTPIITPAVPLVRPQRVRTKPLWMKDYVK